MQDLRSRAGTMLNGTGSGMLAMSVFTPFYAIWPVFAWPVLGVVIFVAALAWSVYLGLTARRLLRLSAGLPDERNEYDARITQGMRVLSSGQGGLIALAAVTLWLLGLQVWILPVVALIVALHFFPMAAMFGRTLDYYLGTMMAIASLAGFTLAGLGWLWQAVWATTGIGGGIVTSIYGLHMVRTARRTLAEYQALVAADRTERE